MIKKIIYLFIFFILSYCIWSCESNEINIPEGAFEESTVILSGTWVISQVLMNDEDITDRLDFSGMKLKLSMENNSPSNFELEGPPTPFITTANGNWEYDDHAYPTAIYFNSGQNQKMANFDAPPISNDDRFTLHFSLGCADNIYIYHFIKQE